MNSARKRQIFLSIAVTALVGLSVPACVSQQSSRVASRLLIEQRDRSSADLRGPFRGISPAGLAVTQLSEGWVAKLYNDPAGYCTIGYGHLIALRRCDGTEPPDWRDGITRDEGTALLVDDMRLAEIAVVANTGTIVLTDGQYAALCDFIFNVGATNYRNSTLRRRILSGELRDVPLQFRRWTKGGGQVLPGLVARREREIELFTGMPADPRNRADLGADELIDIAVGEPEGDTRR
jgi:lysozyme